MHILTDRDKALIEELPNSPEELTQFVLEHGMNVLAYMYKNTNRYEVAQYHWFKQNKDWAVEQAHLKIMDGGSNMHNEEPSPALVIKFTTKGICANLVIICIMRTSWAREEMFELFGVDWDQSLLLDFIRENPGIVIYKKR